MLNSPFPYSLLSFLICVALSRLDIFLCCELMWNSCMVRILPLTHDGALSWSDVFADFVRKAAYPRPSSFRTQIACYWSIWYEDWESDLATTRYARRSSQAGTSVVAWKASCWTSSSIKTSAFYFRSVIIIKSNNHSPCFQYESSFSTSPKCRQAFTW